MESSGTSYGRCVHGIGKPCDPGNGTESRSLGRHLPGALCALAAALIVGLGCSHSREFELREPGLVGNFAAEPPTFLTGPMSALLTNKSGYSAVATIQNESLGSGAQGVTSGQLFCRGSKLLFAPISTEPKKKRAHGGGFAFIWDVASSSGYVLSGALQAYAPVSSGVHATNVVRDTQSAVAANASVQMSDGSATTFLVSPGDNALGVPGRISATGGRSPLVISLSNVRPEVPAEDVFIPSDDFSRYSSAEAMADELAARQRNLRRKSPTEFQPMLETMPQRPQ